MKTAALILAAGAASRMQQPKMLLPFGTKTILAHLLDEVKACGLQAVCLVTGFYHKEIAESTDTENVLIVYNTNWQSGMASSIQIGISTLLQENSGLDSILILVSDQPFLNQGLLVKMLQSKLLMQKGIVAASYDGVKGTPVLFDKKYFTALQELQGDTGAKSILHQHGEDIIAVDFPNGAMDIDTLQDYEQFCAKLKQLNAN